MPQTMTAGEKAESLGATLGGGINWTWADAFPTEAAATEFDEWCNANGYETRGVYANAPEPGKYSVRFR